MRAQAQITSSLRLLGMHGNPNDPHSNQHWHPQVVKISALHAQGLEGFWEAVHTFETLQKVNGSLAARRQHQALAWMWERIDAGLKQSFKDNPLVKQQLPAMIAAVEAGQLAASTAARNLLAALAGQARAASI
jgi:LAO/AO transport system kinase